VLIGRPRSRARAEARDDGDKALAKQIGALPKPSAAAWACNVLVREQRAEIEGLVELGSLLREAQESLAGDELKALNRQRSQLLAALTRQASALARERGRPISTSVADQVEDTLRAAMTEPEAGEALLSGRLTSPMSYSGMGALTGRPDLRLVRLPKPEPAQERTTTAKRPSDAAERRRAREEEARRAAEERRRKELAEARRAAEEATALAEEAAAAVEEDRRTAEALDARQQELQARVAELSGQLARAEHDAAQVGAEFKRAERHLRTAERQAAEAAAARDRALAHLADLEADG
jgi:hypothetical protein